MTRRKPIARTCGRAGWLVLGVWVRRRGWSGAYEGEGDDGLEACCHDGVAVVCDGGG